VAGRAHDLQTTDFGGNGGREPAAWGNVRTSFLRRSSNSEYLHGVRRGVGGDVQECSIPFDNLHGPSLEHVSTVLARRGAGV
jgi:hypothetical protein